MKSRNKHIDITKGVGILIIVFGHNWIVFNPKGELFNIIFSFHVPLFFFLSGLFFNPFRSLSSTIVSKFDSLLKPYFVTLVLVGIADAIYKGDNFAYYFSKVLYGNGETIPWLWLQLWFLPHLFAVTVFSWLTIYAFHKIKINENLQYLFMFGLLIIGVNFIGFFWNLDVTFWSGTKTKLPGLPFSIDIIPITIFYFLIGYSLKSYVLKFKPSLIFVLLSLLIFLACHYFFNKTIDLNLRIYDGLFVPTFEAFSGIYLLLSISYMLQLDVTTSRLFSYFGSASLLILIFHRYFQSETFFFAANYLKGKYFLIAIFAFIVGSIIPLVMWSIIKKIDLLALFYLPIKTNNLLRRDAKSCSL